MDKTYEVVYRAKGYSIFNVLHYPSIINLLFPFLASLSFETYKNSLAYVDRVL